MKTAVYNLKNEKVGEIDLPERIFGAEWKPALVQQVLVAQLANRRKPWAHVKTRAEVRGGGRKPWRQKGTGRARHGSIRSPLWVGGGKAHGPNKLRDYSQKINKKMNRLAMFSILSRKLKENCLKVFDKLDVDEPKTKILAKALRLILEPKKNQKKLDVLLVAARDNKNIFRASANIPKTKAAAPESLNVYDLMNYKNIFIDKNAVKTIDRHYKIL
jgi:large subunit ribosomal protein L4